MQSPEVSDLAKKVGVKFNTYKSSPLNRSPPMSEKSNPAVEKVINESIADSYNFFVELVKERRGDKINPKNYPIIFDGRVFTGRQALNLGLIDLVGGINDVEKLLLFFKIDANKTPLKEIEVLKKDHQLIDKFLNFLPFYRDIEGKIFKNKIMAITS